MKNTLITIDSYLSAEDRADSCRNLIKQIREVFDDGYEILLINKSNKDFGLQKDVDYYYNLSNSFMVGYPPEYILKSEKYERPYVYVGTGIGVCENWLPLTGVTDHVAGIYNSFVIASNISNMLGYSHVFKVEYDTVFDIDELRDIKNDIEKEKDYIFYGVRKMGEYAKKHHYLIDVHIVGYSNKIFDGFDIVKNDDEFWRLNEKINYYGKWIEYIIPSVYEYQKRDKTYDGIEFEGFLRNKYPNSKFDIINGDGEWTEKWKNMPKVCYMKNDTDEENFNIGLFYWNEETNDLNTVTKIYDEKGDEVYNSELILKHKFFNFDKVKLNDKTLTIKKKNTINGHTKEYSQVLTKESITNSNVHFKYNN